jgi:hypothetical protein
VPLIQSALVSREVKRQADFLGIASRYASLRRFGRQCVGLCPFHSERHPSFYVHPEKKIFYCFGCRAGGDVLDFVMRMERLPFALALEWVARFPNGGSGDRRTSERSERVSRKGRRPLVPAKQAGCIDGKPARPEVVMCVEGPSLDCAAERAIETVREAGSFTCQRRDNR